MQRNTFVEVGSWTFVVASLVTFSVGVEVVPAGWLSNILVAVNVVILFGSYTTAYRANLSKAAQEYLRNAQSVIVYGNWSGGIFSSVLGY